MCKDDPNYMFWLYTNLKAQSGDESAKMLIEGYKEAYKMWKECSNGLKQRVDDRQTD